MRNNGNIQTAGRSRQRREGREQETEEDQYTHQSEFIHDECSLPTGRIDGVTRRREDRGDLDTKGEVGTKGDIDRARHEGVAKGTMKRTLQREATATGRDQLESSQNEGCPLYTERRLASDQNSYIWGTKE